MQEESKSKSKSGKETTKSNRSPPISQKLWDSVNTEI